MEGSEFADLMVEGDTSLDSPDLTQERLDRLERNRLVMKEEEKQKNKTEKQMEEGELLVENIQRAWRTYVRRKSEHTSTGEIDDTEKDRDTEKEIKASSCKSQQTSNKNSCDIEKASFVNDRTISTSDFKLEDNDKNAIRSAADSGTEFEVADDNVRIVIEGCEKDKDRLVKDTQSVDSLSGLSDSTPEENTQHRTHDSTPEDDRVYLGYENSKQHVLNKLKQDSDADCVSIASDYSEVSVPLRELAESEVEIVQKADLADKSFVPSSTANSAIQRNPEETDEEFSKRVRKINLLSIAQEFADLKKVNAKALPFGLHKSYIEGESSSSGESSRQSSEMNTPSDPSITFNDNDITRGCKNQRGDLNSNISENNSLKSKKNSNSKKNDNDKSTVDGSENDGDFDVYNIETAVPNMDWEALERQLQLATQEEQTRQKVCIVQLWIVN
ncbi:hypothetical protein FSP39_009375 [Pinctada imbricata]|uniref:Uncharacterized protein n=1 Tax=Pinctada imbricata TaxID=66713 RepID=A0AA88XYP8_PINIB|nr:hypothetical protein FSP39_009375 [Pinctada imbricata]